MSVKYSTSPTLHLAIADSPRYRHCQWLFHLLLGLAALDLAFGGYPFCGLLLPLLPVSCYLHRRQPLVGAILVWHLGQWSLRQAGSECPIEVRRGHCLPWLTCVRWHCPSGKPGVLLLFSDSASRNELRRLRVRLRLQHGVCGR